MIRTRERGVLTQQGSGGGVGPWLSCRCVLNVEVATFLGRLDTCVREKGVKHECNVFP